MELELFPDEKPELDALMDELEERVDASFLYDLRDAFERSARAEPEPA